jgi:CRISPR-associated protein Cas2
MLYAISYDIADNGRRQRVHEALKDYGRWVQYSVFECELDEKGLAELKERLARELDPESDSCYMYGLCRACADRVEILGKAVRYRIPEVVII